MSNKQPACSLRSAAAGLPTVECKVRATQSSGYGDGKILIQRKSARDLQFLIGQHNGSRRMIRQCLKLLCRETAAISGVLPGANDIQAGLCWGVYKSFH